MRLQRTAFHMRYFLGAGVAAMLMVSHVDPEAAGMGTVHGRLVRMDVLPPDVCSWPAAVQWADQASARQGRRALMPFDDSTK